MNETADRFANLNTAQYLYLRQLSEPRDNALRIVVQEATSNRAKAAPLEIPGNAGKFFDGNAWPIESTETCRTFILHWRRYVAYLVTEGAVGSCGDYKDEVFIGRFWRKYEKSHLLDHVARDTGGHLASLQHFKIICLNHKIDVVSTKPPEIEVLEGAAPNASPPAVQ
jgi:hypothetical protein